MGWHLEEVVCGEYASSFVPPLYFLPAPENLSSLVPHEIRGILLISPLKIGEKNFDLET